LLGVVRGGVVRGGRRFGGLVSKGVARRGEGERAEKTIFFSCLSCHVCACVRVCKVCTYRKICRRANLLRVHTRPVTVFCGKGFFS